MSHWDFYLHFPDDSCFFSCACWLSTCILWKNVFSSPLPIFNQVACFFDAELYEFLYVLDNNLLSDILFINIFSHSVGEL